MDCSYRKYCAWSTWIILLAFLGLLNGCAQPPPKQVHRANYKSDFGKRLDISVNYHITLDTALVVVDISNPRNNLYRYWLVQVSSTDGQIITASRRVFTGEDKTKQLVFRLPLPIEGVSEAFHVEVFDEQGELVMASDPITHSSKEG